MEIDYKTIGHRMSERRRELGITQKDMAKQINISNNHLSNIEKGNSSPSFELFCAICSFLKVSMDYIVSGGVKADISQDIIAKLGHCSDEDKITISQIIDVFIEK